MNMDDKEREKATYVLQERENLINDVLTQVGFGKVQFVMIIGCGLMTMATILETAGAAHITTPLSCVFVMSSSEVAFLKASTFLGMVFSACFWSFLCDRYGRRTILLYSMSICTIISFLAFQMPEFYSYITFRILVGVFVSGPNFVCITYLTEFSPPSMIAVIANSMAMFNGMGMTVWPAIAKEILPLNLKYRIGSYWEYGSWRLLGTIYLLPGLGGVFIIAFLPESPKYLAFHSKRKCLGVLSWICKQNKGKHLSFYTDMDKCERLFAENLGKWYTSIQNCCSEVNILCNQKILRNFGTLCLLNFTLSSICFSLTLWNSDLRYKRSVLCPELDNTICCGTTATQIQQNCVEKQINYYESMLLGLCYILLYVIIGIGLQYSKRRWVFAVALIFTSAFGFMLPFVNQNSLVLISLFFFIAIPTIVINIISSAVVEYVPTIFRARAIALCFISGRLGVLFGTFLFGYLLRHYCVNTICYLSIFPVIAAVLSATGYVFP